MVLYWGLSDSGIVGLSSREVDYSPSQAPHKRKLVLAGVLQDPVDTRKFGGRSREFKVHLEGQGDLVRRSIMGIIKVTVWVIGVINLLTTSP